MARRLGDLLDGLHDLLRSARCERAVDIFDLTHLPPRRLGSQPTFTPDGKGVTFRADSRTSARRQRWPGVSACSYRPRETGTIMKTRITARSARLLAAA